MEVRKEGERTIIDLTKDKDFNEYIAHLNCCRRRDKKTAVISLVIFGLLIFFWILVLFL